MKTKIIVQLFVCFFCATAFSQITFVASATAYSASTTLTINKPAGTAQNDVMLAHIAVEDNDGSVDITPPAGWTLVRDLNNFPYIITYTYYKVAGASEPGSYAFTRSTATYDMFAAISTYSGADPSAPIEAEDGQNTAAGNSHDTPSINTTSANDMIVCFFVVDYDDGCQTWTPPGSMTERYDGCGNNGWQSISSADVIQASAGATGTPTAISSASGTKGTAQIIALKPGVAIPMNYSSSTTTQGNVSNVYINTGNSEVLGIQIVTSGYSSPLSVTTFTFNTTGCTNAAADIANAKVFYTSISSSFGTSAPFGSTVASPNGTFTFTGSQTLSNGTNYFWLTYDVTSGATVGNLIDGQYTGLTVTTVRTPTTTNPAGSRQIDPIPVAPLIQWDKTLGGMQTDWPEQIIQTSDGGYMVGGYSCSSLSGNRTVVQGSACEYWIVKLNSTLGISWQKAFGAGGITYNVFSSLQQTSDGGYILAGSSDAGIGGAKTEASRGGYDYWLIKTDAAGNFVWDKTIGGSAADQIHSVKQTSDGGYIVVGSSSSGISGDKTEACQGGVDYWVIKLNSTGGITWQNTIGGSADDKTETFLGMGSLIQQTSDGGYIVGGYSDSGISGDKTEISLGSVDYWVIKLNSTGGITWQNTIGGTSVDFLYSVSQTTDGGYILGGSTLSGIGGDKTEASVNYDYWLVKLDNSGNITWQNTIGGTDIDHLRSAKQTAGGSYILGGYSQSGIGRDKTEASKGLDDYWLVKTDASGNVLWDKTMGGSSYDNLSSLQQTSDGGYIVCGMSQSGITGDKTEAQYGSQDFWVIKLGSGSSLPIELLEFHAQALSKEEKVKLTWITASEINNDYFTLQRSRDAVNWENMKEVNGAGNSPSTSSYLDYDTSPYKGTSYYRLKQTDFDGQSSYSDIRAVRLEGIEFMHAYPVPTGNFLNITINTYADTDVIIELYNALGQLVLQKNEQLIKGVNDLTINTEPFAEGNYLIKVQTTDLLFSDKILFIIE